VQWINFKKWSPILRWSAPATPNQDLMYCHKELNKSQWMNKWDAVSSWSHLATHLAASCWRMLRLRRLIFVGNLSCNNLQAKIDTFRRTCWCQLFFGLAHLKFCNQKASSTLLGEFLEACRRWKKKIEKERCMYGYVFFRFSKKIHISHTYNIFHAYI